MALPGEGGKTPPPPAASGQSIVLSMLTCEGLRHEALGAGR